MATLTSLLVKMGLETATLRRDLNRGRREFRRFADDSRRELRRINDGFTGVATGARKLAGALGAVSLGSFATEQVRAGSETAKFARTLGTTTENLSSLAFAGDLANVRFNTLAQLLQRQTRRIGEAAAGYGEAKGVLDELGLSAEALSQLDAVEIFRTLAPQLRGARNEADALRIATKLFDTEGAQAALRLVQNLEDSERQARELGAVLRSDTARSFEEFEDSVTRLRTVLGSAFRFLVDQANTLVSAVQGVAEFFARFAVISPNVDALRNVNRELEKTAARVAELRAAEARASASGRAPGLFNPIGLITNALDGRRRDELRQAVTELERLTAERDRLRNLLGETSPRQTQNSEPPQRRNPTPGQSAAADELRRQVEQAQETIERLRFSTFDAQGQIAVTLAGDLAALRQAADVANISQRELLELERALSQSAAASIAELQQQSSESTEVVSDFAQQMLAISDQAARNMQDAFADFLFDPFEDGLKGMLSSFIDTLRRMVAQAAAANIFQALGGSGATSGISSVFRSLVGGASTVGAATGTATTAAAAATSGKAGRFGSAKSGATVVINQTVDARGADAGLAARLPGILDASSRATEARVYDTLARGLVPT